MSTKHKCFGDTPLLAADGNFADPVATEECGCPPPTAPSDKILTHEMLYDSDPESFFHTCPIYVKTSTRKESIFAGKDKDHNRDVPDDYAGAHSGDPANNILTKTMVSSLKNSNIEICYDSDPESLFHTCPRVTLPKLKHEPSISTNQDDLMGIGDIRKDNINTKNHDMTGLYPMFRSTVRGKEKECVQTGVLQHLDHGGDEEEDREKIYCIEALNQNHPLRYVKPPYNEAEEKKFTSDYKKLLQAAEVWVPTPPKNGTHCFFDITDRNIGARLKLRKRLEASTQKLDELFSLNLPADVNMSSDEEWFSCNESEISERSGGSGGSGGRGEEAGGTGGSGGSGESLGTGGSIGSGSVGSGVNDVSVGSCGSGGSGVGEDIVGSLGAGGTGDSSGRGCGGSEMSDGSVECEASGGSGQFGGRGGTKEDTNRMDNWKQWDIFHKAFHCDFDYISVTGSIKVLHALIGECTQISIPDRLDIGAQSKTTSDSNTLCIGGPHPYYIYVAEYYKNNIIEYLRKPYIRGVSHPPATNKSLLLFKSITMNSKDFYEMLETVGIETVTLIGFGSRASVAAGVNVMRRARYADPRCFCEFDMAVNIPPSRMHWARFDVHNRAPMNEDDESQHSLSRESYFEMRALQYYKVPDEHWPPHILARRNFYPPLALTDRDFGINLDHNDTISTLDSVITLVACTNRSNIKLKFGKKTKIDHWPQFPMAQFELTHLQAIPIFGSFTITLPRGIRRNVQPVVQDCDYDDFDTDDEGSVIYDEDYDGTHGE